MTKSNIKSKKGFTIIEVVLVLAIAGLIFLMVFIALPALQRGQRNTQREEDLARFLTAVNDYASNNSGRTPFNNPGANIDNFVTRYIDSTCTNLGGLSFNDPGAVNLDGACSADQFRDPDGTAYRFAPAQFGAAVAGGSGEWSVNGLPNGAAVDHTVYYLINAMCGPFERTAIPGSGDRQIALFMLLEGGAMTCNANS